MSDATFRILVVDDEPDLEHLMRQRLRRDVRARRYELLFAHNGIEALEQMRGNKVDMVLSDINMPQMDGLTLLEQIPQVDPNIRAVIVSAYGDMANIRTAMNRGAFDFVTKPIDFNDLKITIDKTLRHLQVLRDALKTRDQLVAIRNELDVASKMQQSILPTEFPRSEKYELFGNMEPAREVGGDFFDIVALSDECVGLAIADVSGKGVPAALFMMSSRTLLKGAAIGHPGPAAAMGEVNNLLEEDNEASMFVTVFYTVYDPASGELVYCNGGHNPPLIVHPNGNSTVLGETDGIALGIMPGFEYAQHSVQLESGDILLLYTDGVSEAMNADAEEFGMDRLQEVFRANPPKTAEEANQAVFAAVHEFAGGTPQSDDITCLTLAHDARGQG